MKRFCRTYQVTLPSPLFVDKPGGVTSHDVVGWARRLTGVKKIGHAGTLDPLATGLLIILIGRNWTKRQTEFLKQDKTYLVSCRFGVASDTYDVDGSVRSLASAKKIDDEDIKQAVNDHFLGEITQTVPPFSAVKQKGKKLYQLARAGQIDEADLPKRQVRVDEFRLLEFNKENQTASFEVSVSSGTYIRSLIHDLGQALGVGAVVTSLRRTRIGRFNIDEAFLCPWFGC